MVYRPPTTHINAVRFILKHVGLDGQAVKKVDRVAELQSRIVDPQQSNACLGTEEVFDWTVAYFIYYCIHVCMSVCVRVCVCVCMR